MSHDHEIPRNPDDCFQGSTEFYSSPDTDPFTPSYLQARPLVDNVGTRSDGTTPEWMVVPASEKSPAQQYVEWFNGIWHTGDPTLWSSAVFTSDAVMIDPSGVSKGAKQAAASFVLLFNYFPALRGEVVSWAANEREIMINWRFKILPKGSTTPLLVAVIDKFCFADGRVSFRLAYFDIITFVGYLAENFGQDQVFDYLGASFWNAQKTGGLQNLPGMVWNLFKGFFFWPRSVDTIALTATPEEGGVMLEWAQVPDAVSYRVCRANALSGPYDALVVDGEEVVVKPPRESSPDAPLRFEDRTVTRGEAYWYIVTSNFGKWQPVPVVKVTPPPKQRAKARGSLQ